MSRAGNWIECANPDCRQLFKPYRVGMLEGCCSRSCARKVDWLKRQPSREQQIAAVMAAVERELRKIIR